MPLVISNCLSQIGTGLVGNGCVADYASEQYLAATFGLNITSLRFWTGSQYGNCVYPSAPSNSTIQQAMNSHIPGLRFYNWSFDEITHCSNLRAMIPIIQQWARNFHATGVSNFITMSPIPASYPLLDDGSGTGRPAIDILGVLPVGYTDYPDGINQFRQRGTRIWSYTTLVQDAYSPKWLIDFPPINFRIFGGFINQRLRIAGLAAWSVDRWVTDPWTEINNVGVWHPMNNYPGDGTLVYPGDAVGIAGGVAPTMRLKWIRDSMDDYDYIALLKKLGQGAWAMSIAATVARDWVSWTRDNNVLYSARKQMGDKLEQLLGRGAPPPAAGLDEHGDAAMSATLGN